ncbi:MAG: bifunctional sugar-1-phosphate nucleotidylyltransferase/acetyltransferase, partial [Luteolibacter sp.]
MSAASTFPCTLSPHREIADFPIGNIPLSQHLRRGDILSPLSIRYPWDLLHANELYISSLTETVIQGEVHPLAVIEGIVHIGPGTRILPGVFIEGNVVIGANCKIGPNCYIRGNTSIGDHCHIGQSVEIKNCLILS